MAKSKKYNHIDQVLKDALVENRGKHVTTGEERLAELEHILETARLTAKEIIELQIEIAHVKALLKKEAGDDR
jgi:hypothetical protein